MEDSLSHPPAVVTGELVPKDAPIGPKLAEKRRKFLAWEFNKRDEIEEARTARKYYHDKQWTDEQIEVLNRRKQPVVWDNKIKRKIDFIVGVEQRMRRDPKGYPRNPSDTHAADIATAGLRYCCDINRWEQIASDSAHDGLVSGSGIAWVGIEPGRDGPEPKVRLVQIDRFFYDPRSLKPDFSDARYMGVHLWLDIEDAVEKWPDQEQKLRSLLDKDQSASVLTTEQDHTTQWADFEHSRVRVLEFWERTRQGWDYCFFCGETTLESGPSPFLDEDGKPDNPYVAWSPYIDEKGSRYGLIRSMIPLQDEINKRRSKLLHAVSVRQVHIRTGSVEDVDKLRSELSRPDGVIEINGDDKWGETVGILDQSDQIRGQAELLLEAKTSLENIGPNPGLIGKGGGIADQSGRAILAQRDSGMTELSPVMDRLRDWKLRVYRKVWSRMRQAWQGEKWIRVSEYDDAPQFVGMNVFDQDPQTQQLRVGSVMVAGGQENRVPGRLAEIDVDVILEEGPDTITMTEELLEKMAQLGPGAFPPKVLIELSNVPNKDRLLKMMDEASQPPPDVVAMQKRMAELEAMFKASQIDVQRSTVERNRAEVVSKLAQVGVPPAAAGQAFPMPFAGPLVEDTVTDGGGEAGPPMQPSGPPAMPDNMSPSDPEQMMPTPAHGTTTIPMGAPGGLPIEQNALM